MKKKKLDYSHARNAYLLPYIGVMTILCIFFMIQYADYSEKLREKNSKRTEILAQEVKETLRDLQDATVEVMEDGIKVTLPSSVVFDLSIAKLKASAVPILENLAASIKGLDERYLVVVDGHTDDEPVFYGGDFSSNWELSLYRAISVIDFLVGEGNNPELFAAAGHGQFSPLHPNDTPEHKAANRRVEILIRRRTVPAAPLAEVAGTGQRTDAGTSAGNAMPHGVPVPSALGK
ncbi:MAG: OmpA family protein [Elusimicrobiales bacterium]|nr:OmpA family protein [Elusimicrobiales bacterium]